MEGTEGPVDLWVEGKRMVKVPTCTRELSQMVKLNRKSRLLGEHTMDGFMVQWAILYLLPTASPPTTTLFNRCFLDPLKTLTTFTRFRNFPHFEKVLSSLTRVIYPRIITYIVYIVIVINFYFSEGPLKMRLDSDSW